MSGNDALQMKKKDVKTKSIQAEGLVGFCLQRRIARRLLGYCNLPIPM